MSRAKDTMSMTFPSGFLKFVQSSVNLRFLSLLSTGVLVKKNNKNKTKSTSKYMFKILICHLRRLFDSNLKVY